MFQKTKAKGFYFAALLFLLGLGMPAMAQVKPSALSSSEIGGFVSYGAQKTHVGAYTWNSLGMAGGIFWQRSPWVGIEMRGDVFPFYARFKQAPFTAGYRYAAHVRRLGGTELVGYAGGGMARAQDATSTYKTLPAVWAPCWQVSQGISVPVARHWHWQALEVSYAQSYTPLRTIESFHVTTGLTFSLGGAVQ